MSVERPHRRSVSRVLAAATAGLLLAACGSQLDPQEVAATQRGNAGGVIDDAAGASAPGTSANGGGSTDTTDTTGTSDPGAQDPGATGPAGTNVDPSTNSGTDPGAPAPGGTGPTDTPSSQAPTGGTQQGSCDGFKNQTGITDSTITLANASDISGPVPGLFQASRQGTQAFVAYFNATQKLCGRSLRVLDLDSRTDASADQEAYATACSDSFAAVGSTSSFDQGGAATAQACGLPDVRATILSPERQRCTTCFGAYAISTGQIADALPRYWLKAQPTASQHVGIFYVNVAAASINAQSFKAAYVKAGMKVPVLQGIDVSDFNYSTYVQQMKDNDIDFVQYFGPYQYATKLQQAMAQQSFKPRVYLEDPTIYDATYLSQAAGSGNGSYVYSPIELLDDLKNPEIALYRSWLDQVAPGATPNYYGLFAWSAARLFVEQAAALGGKLTRASLVASLKKVKGWTDNGAHAPMAVGAKTTSPCIKIIQLDGSTWKQVSPGDFMCGGLIETGVGG